MDETEGTVAVLTPETETDISEEMNVAETEQEEEGSETEPITEAEIEERIEAARKETEERVREQAREEATKFQQEQRTRELDATWQKFSGDFLTNYLRGAAAWGAKQGNEGRTGEEVGAMYQTTHARQLLDEFQKSAMPYMLKKVYDDLAGALPVFLGKEFSDWTPSKAVLDKYHQSMRSNDAASAFGGLVEYLKAAYEEHELPKRVEAARKASAESNKKGEAVKNLQNPPKEAGPVKGGGGTSSLPSLTPAQIEAMPMSQWLALGDSETREKILENAHRRAAGKR